MTKKDSNILKIITPLFVLLLGALAVYYVAFYSSDSASNTSQEDTKKQKEDNIQKENTPETNTNGNIKSYFAKLGFEGSMYPGRCTLVGGFTWLGGFLWYYRDNLPNSLSGIGGLEAQVVLFGSLLLLALSGYICDTYTKLNSYVKQGQSVINPLVILAPSAILSLIEYILRLQQEPNNVLSKRLRIGCLVGLAIGLLTFTISSYCQCYAGKSQPDSIRQFFAKLNPVLEATELITLGGLSVIVALLSAKVGNHDIRSWETAAILGGAIGVAVLTTQVVHTLTSKRPDKCTLVGALTWLGLFFHLYKDVKNYDGFEKSPIKAFAVFLLALGFPALGYLFDTKWNAYIASKESWINITILVLSCIDLFLVYRWENILRVYIGIPIVLLEILVIYFNRTEMRNSIKSVYMPSKTEGS